MIRVDVEVTRGAFRLAVDLRVERGEVLAVLGPNGSGKSTLLDVIAGTRKPDAGVVELGGRPLTDVEAGVHVPPHRRRIGLLAQDALLFPHLTALSNVAFGPRAAGWPKGAAAKTAQQWLRAVDALDLADRKPAALSGGQAQRVAVARLLATRPDLVLLDEPFAALDVDAAPALRGLLRRVLREQSAVLVTHDPLDALALADRVAVLADGRVVEVGPTGDVLSRPRTAFAARVAGLNLITGTACPDGLRTPDGLVRARGAVPDGERAVAVFSPRDVAVYLEWTSGSPRNAFPAVVAGMEPHGDIVRVRAGARPDGPPWVAGLAADVLPPAVAELGLEPGTPVYLVVKATEIGVHPAARSRRG